jgi:hypothetical protein
MAGLRYPDAPRLDIAEEIVGHVVRDHRHPGERHELHGSMTRTCNSHLSLLILHLFPGNKLALS